MKVNVAFMNLLNGLEKPVEIMSKWLEEPLKRAQHKRDVEAQTVSADLEVKRRTEVLRIVAEIDELKRDAGLERLHFKPHPHSPHSHNPHQAPQSASCHT